MKRNFTERTSFTDQSLIRERNESALSSLKFFFSLFFFWYINPLFRESWLEEVWVGFMFAINLYGEESRAT